MLLAETEYKERVRPLRALKYLLAGILVCAVVGAGCFLLGRRAAEQSGRTKVDAVVLQGELTDISEWATASYQYTNMAQFQNSSDFYGVTLPFTTKSFILTYDGEITAGVDMERASVSVSGTTVTVTLPEAEILSHEIDQNSVEIFDEKTSIFNPFTVEDFTAFQADQEASMEQKAVSKGLLDEAKAKAQSSVQRLMKSALPENYTLTVQ